MKEARGLHRLIASYQSGQISDEAFAELEEALWSSGDAREQFHRLSRIDGFLRSEAERNGVDSENEAKIVSTASAKSFQSRPFFKGVAAAAAVVLLSALTWTIAAQKRVIGTLVSAEEVTWDTLMSSEPGTPITRGSIRLSSGIATFRLVSGVELTLEGPARLFLKGPGKASLARGTIVVNAKEADEFYLEVNHGQAIGGKAEYVAVSASKQGNAEFESLSGTVMVGHDRSREVVQLSAGEKASISEEKLDFTGEELVDLPFEPTEKGMLIRSAKSATFIRNNNPDKWTRPEFLTMKRSNIGHGFDQFSLVNFDLSRLEASRVETVTLRMNLVPSGIGLASYLPKMNRFAVFGLQNAAKENWTREDPWEEAPSPEDGRRLVEFEISRGQQTGTIELSSDELREFIANRAGDKISLLLFRETANKDGQGPGLVHAIASDAHPEIAGPVLEISLKD